MGTGIALGEVSGEGSGMSISAEGLLTSSKESRFSRGSSGDGAGVATLAAGVASAEEVAEADSSCAAAGGGKGRALIPG